MAGEESGISAHPQVAKEAEPPERFRLPKRILRYVDRAFEYSAIGLLVAMIVIVFAQVITRKLFGYVFFWSEEITLLCLTWFSFMGIAIGCRERLHLAMDVITGFLPAAVNRVLDRVIAVTTVVFGLYLLIYGLAFTWLMGESSLPATGLPNSVQYVVIPLTGLLICVHAVLQITGADMRRFQHVQEEITRDDA